MLISSYVVGAAVEPFWNITEVDSSKPSDW